MLNLKKLVKIYQFGGLPRTRLVADAGGGGRNGIEVLLLPGSVNLVRGRVVEEVF